jgi:uncharacterized iron-regulated membrane protein
MPSSIYGVPIYLAFAIVCFIVVVIAGLARGGWRQRTPEGGPVPMRGQGGMLQTIAAILGILSFVIQVLQWLKII